LTNASTKPIPIPAILVFGKPTSPDVPQASWFHAEDRPTVLAAAQSLKFSVLDIQTAAEKALTLGVHEGVLKGNGRMIVGSVTPEVYKRIEEYAAKANAEAPAKSEVGGPDAAKPAIEQNKNKNSAGATATTSTLSASSGGKAADVGASSAWDALRVGDHVVGKYWEEDGHPNGWWIGIVSAIDGDDFVIRWPDEPRKPPVKIERRHIAILDPSYDVTTEWQRRR
jgi:hypothetical protein